MAEEDAGWRRPDPVTDRVLRPAAYSGPPAAAPPPAGWQPPLQEPVASPRELPALDHDAIDLAERSAAHFTYALGLAALAVVVLMACSRLF